MEYPTLDGDAVYIRLEVKVCEAGCGLIFTREACSRQVLCAACECHLRAAAVAEPLPVEEEKPPSRRLGWRQVPAALKKAKSAEQRQRLAMTYAETGDLFEAMLAGGYSTKTARKGLNALSGRAIAAIRRLSPFAFP